MQYRYSSELLTSDAVFEPMQGKQSTGCVGAKHHLWSLTWVSI